jgi:hypothetical protein
MPPSITARPSASVSMVAYQRSSASCAASFTELSVALVNSELPRGVLPPLMSKRPSPS